MGRTSLYRLDTTIDEGQLMLEGMKPIVRVNACKVRTYYETLESTDSKLLKQYMDDEEGWKPAVLSRSLREFNVYIDPKVIARHRARMCSCKQLNA